MRISENVHQIRIDFSVTEQVKRYVYVYLITGKDCYLVDSGVAGSETVISDYMHKLGRDVDEIKGLFLTHAHPDHIGSAAAIQKLSGCKIYASEKERRWIEDIGTQFKERPIPNFHTLVQESVLVDEIVKEGDILLPESRITLKVLDTPGHSVGHISYVYEEEGVIFSGDAIPDTKDFPIFVDEKLSEMSIEKMEKLELIRYCCPAWDRVYEADEWKEILHSSREFLQRLKRSVQQIEQNGDMDSEESRLNMLGEFMGWKNMDVNPLFKRSIEACKE